MVMLNSHDKKFRNEALPSGIRDFRRYAPNCHTHRLFTFFLHFLGPMCASVERVFFRKADGWLCAANVLGTLVTFKYTGMTKNHNKIYAYYKIILASSTIMQMNTLKLDIMSVASPTLASWCPTLKCLCLEPILSSTETCCWEWLYPAGDCSGSAWWSTGPPGPRQAAGWVTSCIT